MEQKTTSLPLPRLVLRVGGLGNRNFDQGPQTPTEWEGIIAGEIAAVYGGLAAAVKGVQETDAQQVFTTMAHRDEHWLESRFGWFFGKADRWERSKLATAGVCPAFTPEKPLITVLTGLAKGGDMLLAEAVLDPDLQNGLVEWQHTGIVVHHADHDPYTGSLNTDLPFSVGTIPARPASNVADEATLDGATQRAKAHALARISSQRAFGFRAQAEALRHHADILVAVWDTVSEGKPGGTRESVEFALRERIPVLALRIDVQGAVQCDLLQGPEDLWEEPGTIGYAQLGSVIKEVLAFPDKKADSTAYDPRVAFYGFLHGSLPAPRLLGLIWTAFVAWTKRRAARHAPTAAHKPTKTTNSGPEAPTAYERAKRRASDMAKLFGDAHRGGVALSYLLGISAVCAAVAGGIAHGVPSAAHGWVVLFAVMEMVLIIFLFALSLTSRSEAWHTAWTDVRILAEALRCMKYLHPLGVHTPLPKLPPHLSDHDQDPKQLWSVWYFRMLVKQVPVGQDVLPAATLHAFRDHLVDEWIGLNASTGHFTAGQGEHHTKNSHLYAWQSEFFERVSTWLFRAILACASLHSLGAISQWQWLHALHYPMYIICVIGPVALGVILGFTTQIELRRIEERSKGMTLQLRARALALSRIPFAAGATLADPAELRWSLTREAIATANLMVDETASWALIYRNTGIHAG